MVVILGITGMVIDLGNLMLERQKLSDAVDSAALSGAQELMNDEEQARDMAYMYANENGVVSPSISIDMANKKIAVTGKRMVPFYFAKILGFDHTTAEATATAQIKPLSGAKGIVPLSVVAPNPNATNYGFQLGAVYMLKYDPKGASNGNFGPLALGGTGASNYEHNLLNGYENQLTINSEVKTETGNMSGPTQRAIQQRLNLDAYDSGCQTYDLAQKNRNCKRVVYVPVIDSLNLNGRGTVNIIGFVAFYIETVGGNGNQSIITGRFMKSIYSGDWDNSNTNDSGLYAVKLVK